ncbi:MAG: ACP S-malonyltransferase [Phycisphaeraceae bacterium]|nr:ACP S-malonyltransferase [Phycisphaeraceae bacterium]
MTDQASIVLCPGQGAQHVGMARLWLETSDAARKVFAEAQAALGMDVAKLCVEGPAETINRTDIAQPLIYTASVAGARGLMEQGKLTSIAGTAGLSLGEFTALHLAGALSFVDGLKLLKLRGQAMQDAAEKHPGSMVALTGAEDAQAEELCRRAGEGGVLVAANFNCPGQIVISGDREACERAVKAAGEMGLKATPLAVSGAFHSPLMKSAAERLAEAMTTVSWTSPRVPVLSNVTAVPHETSVQSIQKRLVEQLTHPVRWSQSMTWMTANWPGHVVELPPGRVLSGLMRRINRQVSVQNCAEPA